MFDELFRSIVILPFAGVPIALVAWSIFQFTVRKAVAKALAGLMVGAALWGIASLMFLANVYCEHCAGRPVSPREAAAVISYFSFGVAVLLVLWWTARSSKSSEPKQGGN